MSMWGFRSNSTNTFALIHALVGSESIHNSLRAVLSKMCRCICTGNNVMIKASFLARKDLQRDEKIAAPLPFLVIKWLFWNRNLKMIPSEYRDILYVILKILNRSLKWRTVRFWTPTGSASTSRQIWTFEKNARFSSKTEVFFERSTLTAGGGRSSGSSETYCTSF